MDDDAANIERSPYLGTDDPPVQRNKIVVEDETGDGADASLLDDFVIEAEE